MAKSGWIGVDLDGTLAIYGPGTMPNIGEPIPTMIERVKNWLKEGVEVKIFTARVSPGDGFPEFVEEQIKLIKAWCEEHIGQELDVTATKDFAMIEMWDDRAVQVVMNTGKLLIDSSSLQAELEQAKEFDMREYEYWTGVRWQIISPYTKTIRKRPVMV